MHERGMQIFEGDGLLTTPKSTPYKQGNAVISMKNGAAKEGSSKTRLQLPKPARVKLHS